MRPFLQVLLALGTAAADRTGGGPRHVLSLNKGWKQQTIYLPPDADVPSFGADDRCSARECSFDYEPINWKSVTLPHDFIVESSIFNKTNGDKNHGYLPLGYSHYRKYFKPQLQGIKKWRLEFEGCMWRCHVYLNEEYLGHSSTGYVPFSLDVTGKVLTTKRNLLAVVADATNPDSWWYDGGGLYRNVQLVAMESGTHIAQYGVYVPSMVQSPIQPETRTDPAVADAVVMASADIESPPDGELFSVMFNIFDDENQQVASAEQQVSTDKLTMTAMINITIPKAKLWSINHPTLYTVETILLSLESKKVLDKDRTRIGIRKLAWDASKGFFLNDVSTKILGVANHQDFAGVGVAVPDSLQAFRVTKIKELGGNGWRTAHNAPTVALLHATDRLGMLVWDENHRNGETENAKTLVKRDRNHPSVIIWSICNEVLCDCGDGVTNKTSIQKANEIKRAFQELDPHGQRVVSANQNDWIMENSVLDLFGFDYGTDNYDEWHSTHPSYPSISSESCSAVGDRGEYANDKAKGHVSGYGSEAVGWGQTDEKGWGGYNQGDLDNTQGILTRSFVAGGFTWTGFDYKGEPTPYAWPDINSHFGIYDIAGFDKDRVGWYKSWWATENNKPHVDHLHLYPHWNWAVKNISKHLNRCKNRNGEVEVRVYSNAASVELFLNGKSQGRKAMPRYGHLAWNVTFAPGNITARSYKSAGAVDVIQEVSRVTTGPPTQLEAKIVHGVGTDGVIGDDEVALVRVNVLDQHGRLVPIPNEHPVFIKFEVASQYGKLIGTGNGDPSDHTNDKSPVRKAYHGSVLGIFQAASSEEGTPSLNKDSDNVEIKVSSAGLDDVVVVIPIRKGSGDKQLKDAMSVYL